MTRFSKSNLINAFKNRADRIANDFPFDVNKGLEQIEGKSLDVCVAYGSWRLCQNVLANLSVTGRVNKVALENEFRDLSIKLAASFGLDHSNGTFQLRKDLGNPEKMAAYGEMRLSLDLVEGIYDGSFLRFWAESKH